MTFCDVRYLPLVKVLCQSVLYFLSPARRGRVILVVPVFCPASGIRRHFFAKIQKLLIKSF